TASPELSAFHLQSSLPRTSTPAYAGLEARLWFATARPLPADRSCWRGTSPIKTPWWQQCKGDRRFLGNASMTPAAMVIFPRRIGHRHSLVRIHAPVSGWVQQLQSMGYGVSAARAHPLKQRSAQIHAAITVILHVKRAGYVPPSLGVISSAGKRHE